MDDFEINKRLAEIAGVDVVQDDFGMPWSVKNSDRHWCPLCDWSQLGPLMERHWVDLRPDTDEASWRASCKTKSDMWACLIHPETDLKRAVCLAIIAAHAED